MMVLCIPESRARQLCTGIAVPLYHHRSMPYVPYVKQWHIGTTIPKYKATVYGYTGLFIILELF